VLDEVELVAGEQDRGPAAGALAQHRRQVVGPDRVQAGERLVEHEQLRIMDERGGELDALLVAQRQLLDLGVQAPAQPEALAQLPAGARGPRRAHPVQAPEVLQLVEHHHAGIQAALLRHVAEALAHLGVDRAPVEEDLARVQGDDTEHGAHRGRLARAVGAEEPDNPLGGHAEAHPVESHDGTEPAPQLPELEQPALRVPTRRAGLNLAQTVWTWNRLVVPGAPLGRPAVMPMRSPRVTQPSSTARSAEAAINSSVTS
jgi:hypothetical protein